MRAVPLNSVKTEWYQLHAIKAQHPDLGRLLPETLNYWLGGNIEFSVCWESVVDSSSSQVPGTDKNKLADHLCKEYCQMTIGELNYMHVCVHIHLGIHLRGAFTAF